MIQHLKDECVCGSLWIPLIQPREAANKCQMLVCATTREIRRRFERGQRRPHAGRKMNTHGQQRPWQRAETSPPALEVEEVWLSTLHIKQRAKKCEQKFLIRGSSVFPSLPFASDLQDRTLWGVLSTIPDIFQAIVRKGHPGREKPCTCLTPHSFPFLQNTA